MVRLNTFCGRSRGFGKLSSHTRALLLIGACAVVSPSLLLGQGTAAEVVPDTLYENV
jgi:hypothetical protein